MAAAGTEVVMEQSDAEDARAERMRPLLERASAYLRRLGPADTPLSVSFSGRTLLVQPRERAAVWRVLCEGRPPAAPWELHLAEAAAVQLAAMLALEECGAPPPAPALVDELTNLAALGLSVSESLQRDLDALLVAGDADTAKRLATFRSAYAQVFVEVRGLLPAPLHRRTQTAAHRLPTADPGAGDAAARPDAPPPRRETPPEVRPHLDRASAFLRARGAGDGPIALTIGGRTVELSGQERRILWRILVEGRPPLDPWNDLACETMALTLALLAALEPGTAVDPRLVAVANANHEETRRTVDALVLGGEADGARRLTGFRNRLGVALRA
ncbi:MAG: hypothetical protein ACOY3Y_05515, partial [Acidobacteriota bacterium]